MQTFKPRWTDFTDKNPKQGRNAVPDAVIFVSAAIDKNCQNRQKSALESLLAEHGRLALEVPTPDGQQVLITHDPNRLLGFADGKAWWVARNLDGQLLAIHGPAPVDAVVLPDPAPLPDAVVELLLRYEAGEFELEVRDYLTQVFSYNPDDALELLVEAARELGVTGAPGVLPDLVGGQQ